jgi:ABC-2 type transport system permease protein
MPFRWTVGFPAFATTVPAQALTARLTGGMMLLAGVSAFTLFFLSRAFWRVGLRNYTGTSA